MEEEERETLEEEGMPRVRIMSPVTGVEVQHATMVEMRHWPAAAPTWAAAERDREGDDIVCDADRWWCCVPFWQASTVRQYSWETMVALSVSARLRTLGCGGLAAFVGRLTLQGDDFPPALFTDQWDEGALLTRFPVHREIETDAERHAWAPPLQGIGAIRQIVGGS